MAYLQLTISQLETLTLLRFNQSLAFLWLEVLWDSSYRELLEPRCCRCSRATFLLLIWGQEWKGNVTTRYASNACATRTGHLRIAVIKSTQSVPYQLTFLVHTPVMRSVLVWIYLLRIVMWLWAIWVQAGVCWINYLCNCFALACPGLVSFRFVKWRDFHSKWQDS